MALSELEAWTLTPFHAQHFQAMSWHGDLFECFSETAISNHLYQKAAEPPAFETLKGHTFWSYLEADPSLQANFSQAMQNVDSICKLSCHPPN